MHTNYSLSFTSFTKFKKLEVPQNNEQAPAPDNTNISSSDTSSRKIDLRGAEQKFIETCKNNAEKIKALSNELKQMKLPSNATKEEISEYILKVQTMQKQASEYYGSIKDSPVHIRCAELDDLVHSYNDFTDLANSKIETAKYRLQFGEFRDDRTNPISDSFVSEEDVAEESSSPSNISSSDTSSRKIDLRGAEQKFIETCKNNAEKIKALSNELKQMKLPSNATKEEISEYILKVQTMQKQASEYYGSIKDSPVHVRCAELDDLVHSYNDFTDLTNSKIEAAKYRLQFGEFSL